MDKILPPLTFRTIRNALGLTPQDVADACSVNVRTAQRWESTKTAPMDAQMWLQDKWGNLLNYIEEVVEAADNAWLTTLQPVVLFAYLNEEKCQAKHGMSVAQHQALLGHIGVALDMEEIPWDVVNIEDADAGDITDPLAADDADDSDKADAPMYTSSADYLHHVVEPALGEYVDDYDTEAIASDMLEWVNVTDDDGNMLLNRSGLVENTDLDFWEVAARHELSDKD